jgi:hypothetical protein
MGILERVIKAKETEQDFIKALVYGNSGTGKSTMCGTAPRNILYLWTERQGVISFKRVAPNQDTLEIDSLDTLRAALSELRAPGHGYSTVCLDSLSEMQRLIIDEQVSKTTGKEEPTISDWKVIIDRTASLVRAYRDLPMHVVVTALAEESIVNESDRLIRPSVSGRKLPGQLAQYFNLVGYSFKVVKDKSITYKVLIEGKDDFTCKGLPGLRYREDPDITYWYERGINGCDPRDPHAMMILEPGQQRPASDNNETEDSNEGQAAEETAA